MYKTIRLIHLYAGLILAAYILMYAVTGFVILHSDWFPDNGSKTKRSVALNELAQLPTLTQEQADQWNARLRQELGLRGRPNKPQKDHNESWIFTYKRPGTLEKVHWKPTAIQLELSLEHGGFASLMNRLHHFHGYAGGARFALWGFMVDLVSVAMIFFALSGIYLWYVLKRDHRLGWIILGGSTAYVVGSVIYLVVSP